MYIHVIPKYLDAGCIACVSDILHSPKNNFHQSNLFFSASVRQKPFFLQMNDASSIPTQITNHALFPCASSKQHFMLECDENMI